MTGQLNSNEKFQYAALVLNVFSVTLRRQWQSTSVVLPEKFRAQRSRVGYSPWGRTVGRD